jgi:malonyl CoA-acyl carrier protein transacylase
MPQRMPSLGSDSKSAAIKSNVETKRSFLGGAGTQRLAYHSPNRERVAITGMSIVNALGKSPEEMWANCIALKSGVVPVPPSKWNHALYYNPDPGIPEKTYSNVAAFQDLEVDRTELGISPHDFRTMAKSTKITLWLAQRAIEASGILQSGIPRHRVAVLISQNAGEMASTIRNSVIRSSAADIVERVQSVLSMKTEECKAVEEAIKRGRVTLDDTFLMGRLNSAAAGFICNKYGFQGPSFAVSAACATALVAIFSAYQMIRNGIIDAAVVGGAEEPLTPMHFLNFSALRALAGLSGVERPPHQASRPFDAQRDGMVLGEGGGMIVIERESMARKRGAKVHAYITAMGASSNNFGMVESSRTTQEIAIGASFDDATYGPDEVEVVECHATGTMQGDVEEVLALRPFFSSGNRTVLTSFKSQIGHTLGASGVNGLIRGVMAMNGGVFPPTLNYESPDPAISLEDAGFTVLSQPEDWKLRNRASRRLQLNAFGFGGSNYIVQLEWVANSKDVVMISYPGPAGLHQELEAGIPLLEGIHFFETHLGAGTYRVAVVADTATEAVSLIESAEALAPQGAVSARDLRTLSKAGVYIGEEAEPVKPLSFVFPGQGSQYRGMGRELYQTFPVIREWMDRAAQVAEFDLLNIMFCGSDEDLQNTRWQQPVLFTMEYALVQYLVSLGVRPTALAGHSLGQGTALCLAGAYSFEDGFRLVNKRAECMNKASAMQTDPGVMMAVDAPLEYLEARLTEIDDVHITNINSPRQVVLGGKTEAVQTLGEELQRKGYRRTLLRVSMAFHSPIMECVRDELRDFMTSMEFHSPQVPVISNTTMQPFPAGTSEIKKILLAHLESPVYWMQNVRTLWNDYGIRQFVEVGPGRVLSGLILDTFEEADCIHTCSNDGENRAYRTALAQLFARGHLPVKAPSRTARFFDSGQRLDTGVSESQKMAAPEGTPVQGPGCTDPIVLDQIREFVKDSFGRFVKPGLLEAIRREHDPRYSEQDLDAALSVVLPSIEVGSLPRPQLTRAVEAEIPPSPAPPPEPSEEKPSPGDTDEITEAVIRVIMDATGYERSEIDPSMDLREDLSIRSSRLPVIVDRTERSFGIQIRLSDFSNVRTVAEFANKLREVVSADKKKETIPPQRPGSVASVAETDQKDVSRKDGQPIRRLVCREVPLPQKSTKAIELTENDLVAIFSTGVTDLSKRVPAAFAKHCGDRYLELRFFDDDAGGKGVGSDLRKTEGAAKAAERLAEVKSLAGIVFVMDDLLAVKVKGVDEVSALLCGLFVVMKAFLNSTAKKFATIIYMGKQPGGIGALLYEGALGMFLSLSDEYPSVQFRSVRIDEQTDLSVVADLALDTNQPVVEAVFRNGKVLTREWQPVLSAFDEASPSVITPGDVVVFSGGASGVTYQLARVLAPLGCRFVFLGRRTLDPDIDYLRLLSVVTLHQENRQTDRDDQRKTSGNETGSVQTTASFSGLTNAARMFSGEGHASEALSSMIKEAKHIRSDEDLRREKATVLNALEIVSNVEDLRAAGVEVSYYSCDVTDAAATQSVISQIMGRFGRIDGIVHGAGILKDAFAERMTPQDFSEVFDVKLRGAWNLHSAAKDAGLKFLVCLSSVAAVLGGPGQVNYTAGNRAMSGFVAELRAQTPSLMCKSLMLPPIEGVGMAEDPAIRELMRRLNAGYVHVDELAALFGRELVMGTEDAWVLFMRSLPQVPTILLDSSTLPSEHREIVSGTGLFPKQQFPMIDSITKVDLLKGELQAIRVFSLDKDIWLADHKPYKFLKHQLVSAIMAIEAFMESARILYPHLPVRAIREAEFLNILECPPGIKRHSEILCRRIPSSAGEIVCEVSLGSREVSPTGRVIDRTVLNYKAQVVLGNETGLPFEETGIFPIKREELDGGPLSHEMVLRSYRDNFPKGRYQVLDTMEGTGPDAVRARIVYREGEDFAPPIQTHYQYSPYVLEGLMQACGDFYIGMREKHEELKAIAEAKVLGDKRSLEPEGHKCSEPCSLVRDSTLAETGSSIQGDEPLGEFGRVIPHRIGEIVFSRNCADGEPIVLEGRLTTRSDESLVWEARAADEKGETVMWVRDLELRWVSA